MTYKILAQRVLDNPKRVAKLRNIKNRVQRQQKAEQYIIGDLAHDKTTADKETIGLAGAMVFASL